MLEDVCRPSSIKHVIGGTNKEIPGCVIYGSATPGTINKQTIHTVVDQATRRAKGQQGILVIGTVYRGSISTTRSNTATCTVRLLL